MATAPDFVEQVRQHQKIVHKVCHLYGDSPEDREDLFQEILLNAWKAWPAFRQEAAFTTWLYQVSLNTAISYFRKGKKQPLRQTIDASLTLLSQPADEDTEQQFKAMYLAIGELNKIDKAIVTLYIEQYDYRTIGQMLGLTDNNVAVRMNRIKTFLKEAVKKHL